MPRLHGPTAERDKHATVRFIRTNVIAWWYLHVDKHELIVVEGTLYPLLTRLKNAGLLEYRWEESNAGPPRKYYSLSAQGRAFLFELKGTWENLNNAVEQLTSTPS